MAKKSYYRRRAEAFRREQLFRQPVQVADSFGRSQLVPLPGGHNLSNQFVIQTLRQLGRRDRAKYLNTRRRLVTRYLADRFNNIDAFRSIAQFMPR
jgi:hypothetical protein